MFWDNHHMQMFSFPETELILGKPFISAETFLLLSLNCEKKLLYFHLLIFIHYKTEFQI